MEKRIINFSPPDISEVEIAEVVAALRSGWITTGPRTKLLEKRLAAFIATGKNDIDISQSANAWSNRVVCLGSATAAEELSLRILGVGPGDEVIVPAYTYTASASAVLHCGATVKFVDIQKDGAPDTRMPEMNYERLTNAITDKTKAVVTVDFGGIVCDYDTVFKVVNATRGLFRPRQPDDTPLGNLSSRIQNAIGRVAVVADGAHALGAHRWANGQKRYCGAIADFTSFSFHAVKNLTTSEGGAATWRPMSGIDDAEIYHMYQLLSLHGQNKDALAKSKQASWEYDIIGPWYKCNMTDVAAAMGLGQLDRYEGLLERRAIIVKKYDAACDSLGLPHVIHETPDTSSSKHLYVVRIPGATVEQRNAIILELASYGVSTNVHYKPLPLMTAYGSDCSAFPNAYDYYQNAITLPLHTKLSNEDVDYVCQALGKAIAKCKC